MAMQTGWYAEFDFVDFYLNKTSRKVHLAQATANDGDSYLDAQTAAAEVLVAFQADSLANVYLSKIWYNTNATYAKASSNAASVKNVLSMQFRLQGKSQVATFTLPAPDLFTSSNGDVTDSIDGSIVTSAVAGTDTGSWFTVSGHTTMSDGDLVVTGSSGLKDADYVSVKGIISE